MRLELSPVEPFVVVIGNAMYRYSSVDYLGYSLCYYFGGTIMIILVRGLLLFYFYFTYLGVRNGNDVTVGHKARHGH